MYPLLVFASGLVAGAVGIRLLKRVGTPGDLKAATRSGVETVGARAQAGVDRAQTAVREATVSGLSSIEKASAHLRAKLVATPEDASRMPPPDEPQPTGDAARPAKAKRPAKAGTAAKTADAVEGRGPRTTAATPRRPRKAAAPAKAAAGPALPTGEGKA